MAWWNKKVVFPVKRALVAVAGKVKSQKPGGGGILELHEDVEMCGYEDVQVMWEMVRRSELELSSSAKQRQPRKRHFWRPPAWARRTAAAIN